MSMGCLRIATGDHGLITGFIIRKVILKDPIPSFFLAKDRGRREEQEGRNVADKCDMPGKEAHLFKAKGSASFELPTFTVS